MHISRFGGQRSCFSALNPLRDEWYQMSYEMWERAKLGWVYNEMMQECQLIFLMLWNDDNSNLWHVSSSIQHIEKRALPQIFFQEKCENRHQKWRNDKNFHQYFIYNTWSCWLCWSVSINKVSFWSFENVLTDLVSSPYAKSRLSEYYITCILVSENVQGDY